MEESLSDMLKEHEALDHQIKVMDAIDRIVERTPGATTLGEAEQLTGRSWIELLTDETGLTPEQIQQAADRIAEEPQSE